MISSMQNELGRSPTQQEIFHKALEKDENVYFDEGEVSRIVSNMKIAHLLSRE